MTEAYQEGKMKQPNFWPKDKFLKIKPENEYPEADEEEYVFNGSSYFGVFLSSSIPIIDGVIEQATVGKVGVRNTKGMAAVYDDHAGLQSKAFKQGAKAVAPKVSQSSSWKDGADPHTQTFSVKAARRKKGGSDSENDLLDDLFGDEGGARDKKRKKKKDEPSDSSSSSSGVDNGDKNKT